MTKQEFIDVVGYEPERDDIERVNCSEVGRVGHLMCGTCDEHGKPRFVCACLAKLRSC